MAISFSTDGRSITGDNEDDRILGSGIADFIDGGGGNDEITYRNTQVRGEVFGGPGDDLLSGFPAIYNGGAGDDRITIGRGSDAVGSDGADSITYALSTILPGKTRDTLSGGRNADTLTVSLNPDFLNSGYRQLVVDQAQGRVTAIDSMGTATVLATLSGFERLIAGGQQGAVIKLRGDAGKNLLTGSFEGDILVGRGNADILLGGEGGDFINGGGGDDFLVDGGRDYMIGGLVPSGFDRSSPDTIKGGSGDDLIVALGGRDDIAGNAGKDIIHVNGEGSRVKAGAGDDLVLFPIHFMLQIDFVDSTLGDPDWLRGADLDGGKGRDTLSFEAMAFVSNARSGVTLDLDTDTGFYRALSNLDETFKATDFEILQGSSRDDTFRGTSKNETFFGNRDNDLLDGRGGNDTLDGGAGSDRLKGGAGRDTLTGGDGRDRIDGGRDTDVIALSEKSPARDTVISGVDGGLDFVFDFEALGGGVHDRLDLRDWRQITNDFQLVAVTPDKADPLTGALGQFGLWVLPVIAGVDIGDLKLGVFLSGVTQAQVDVGNDLFLF